MCEHDSSLSYLDCPAVLRGSANHLHGRAACANCWRPRLWPIAALSVWKFAERISAFGSDAQFSGLQELPRTGGS